MPKTMQKNKKHFHFSKPKRTKFEGGLTGVNNRIFLRNYISGTNDMLDITDEVIS